MRCAQPPNGACSVAAGSVTCNDPPGDLGIRADVPAMQCLTRGTKVACGYQCAAVGSDVACAQTPHGACTTQGGLQCLDP